MKEEKTKKKKLTLSVSLKKPYNVSSYRQDKQKTSVVIEKKPQRKWGEKRFQPRDSNFNKIQNLEGWGILSSNNLKKAIEKSKSISLQKFIYSLGIRYIGEINANILANEFISIENLLKSKKIDNLNYEIIHTENNVKDEDTALGAVKRGKKSSICL